MDCIISIYQNKIYYNIVLLIGHFGDWIFFATKLAGECGPGYYNIWTDFTNAGNSNKQIIRDNEDNDKIMRR